MSNSEKNGAGNSVPPSDPSYQLSLVEKTAVFRNSIIQAEKRYMDLVERSRI